MSASRKGLGRGLASLLGEGGEARVGEPRRYRTLPIEFLRPGRFQPRTTFDDDAMGTLVESLRSKGLLQPIVVRPHPDEPDAYEIVAGERRWRAAQRVPLHEVPVVVRELDDRETLEVAIIENVQRQNLSPLEEAAGYGRLLQDFGYSQAGLADAVGKSRSHVANTLRLMNLPQLVRDYLELGELTAGHARALLGAPDPEKLAKEVVRRNLNVRETERLVQAAVAEKPNKTPRRGRTRDANTVALERELADHLGVPVRLSGEEKGQITLSWRSLEELDKVLALLRRTGPT